MWGKVKTDNKLNLKIWKFIKLVAIDSHQDDEYPDEEGSGYDDYDYGFMDQDQEEGDYGPESEDQTEPPLFITEETDLYKRPTAPPIGDKDDFGFVEDPKVKFEQTQFNTQLHKNPNAKSSQHQTVHQQPENSSTTCHTTWLLYLITFQLVLLSL